MSKAIQGAQAGKAYVDLLVYIALIVVVVVIIKKFGSLFSGIGKSLGISNTEIEAAQIKAKQVATAAENSKGSKSPFDPGFCTWLRSTMGGRIPKWFITQGKSTNNKNAFVIAAKKEYNIRDFEARNFSDSKHIAWSIYYRVVGNVKDSPEVLQQIVNSIQTKNDWGYIAYQFQQDYGINLLAFLDSRMDNAEQAATLKSCIDKINSLPTGY